MTSFTFEGRTIEAEDGETVLSALLRGGHEISNGCQAGACQACLLRSGDSVPRAAQNGLDDTLIERGIFLSCQAKASDIQSAERLDNEVFPRFAAKLVDKQWVTDDVIIASLKVDGWQGSPGRFIRLHSPDGVSRPYSLAAPAWMEPEFVQLHIRYIPGGAMSESLKSATVGNAFEIEGPFGKCCYRTTDQQEPILLIGSGTGLAPLYGIVTDALRKGHEGPISLHFGAATSSRLYFQSELKKLTDQHPNFQFHTYADSEVLENDRVGSPLDGALKEHAKLDGYKVYLCGHPNLVKAGQRKCFLAGASLKDIFADAFVAA